MVDRYWHRVHQRALTDTFRALQFESTERVVIAAIICFGTILAIWLIGDANDTRGELLTRISSTLVILLLLPALYVWRLLKTPALLDKEKSERIAAITQEVRAEALLGEQIAATRMQVEFFRSLLGPTQAHIYDTVLKAPVAVVMFTIEDGIDEYSISLQDVRCESEAALCLRLGTTPNRDLKSLHNSLKDYSCTSDAPVFQSRGQEILLTPILATKPSYGARIEIKLSYLAARSGNATVSFRASGFRATTSGMEYFAADGSGALLASQAQVTHVAIIATQGIKIVSGRILGGPILNSGISPLRLPSTSGAITQG